MTRCAKLPRKRSQWHCEVSPHHGIPRRPARRYGVIPPFSRLRSLDPMIPDRQRSHESEIRLRVELNSGMSARACPVHRTGVARPRRTALWMAVQGRQAAPSGKSY
ncbi:hypothetical protein DR64_8462 [Paraburkholderia xenovorans LB400]|nr:hypothetical protein DR64_8462 [Paraburkholderia xenovorans LB400]